MLEMWATLADTAASALSSPSPLAKVLPSRSSLKVSRMLVQFGFGAHDQRVHRLAVERGEGTAPRRISPRRSIAWFFHPGWPAPLARRPRRSTECRGRPAPRHRSSTRAPASPLDAVHALQETLGQVERARHRHARSRWTDMPSTRSTAASCCCSSSARMAFRLRPAGTAPPACVPGCGRAR